MACSPVCFEEYKYVIPYILLYISREDKLWRDATYIYYYIMCMISRYYVYLLFTLFMNSIDVISIK